MRNLTFDRARHIQSLAALAYERYRRDYSDGELVSGDGFIEALTRSPTTERINLEDEVESLTHGEALELVALMYVGRGDSVEDELDPASVREAFEGHLESFQTEATEHLAWVCLEKDLALHEYLAWGLERVSRAY